MDDIFNLSTDDFKEQEKKRSVSQHYKTDPKDAKDGVYKAILRFLPNLKAVNQSIVKKYTYWLEDSEGKGFYVDCPSSIGEKSILGDTYWKLKKSPNALEQKQSEALQRKEYYYSYVLVVKDFQNSALDGTVQVFRYPKTIRKMIAAQLTLDEADIANGVEATNVFDLFKGKDFSLKVGLKGGFWNYEQSMFLTKNAPITINGVQMERNEECRATITALYNGVPDLDSFSFKPWTEETNNRVLEYLSTLTGETVSASVSKVSAPERKTVTAPPRATQQPAAMTQAPPRQAPAAGSDNDLAGQSLVTEKVDTGAAPSKSELDQWLEENA